MWLLQTLLSNAVFVTVLALPVWGVCRLAKSPALTHVLWTLLLVKLLTPPLVHVPLPVPESLIPPLTWDAANVSREDAGIAAATPNEILPVASQYPDRVMASANPHATSMMSPRGWSTLLQQWVFTNRTIIATTLLTLWIGVGFLRFLCKATCLCRFKTLLHRYGQFSTEIQNQVDLTAAQMGISNPPQVRVLDRVVSPMVFGCGPCVALVFPAGLWTTLDEQSRRSLITHELAHYQRGDLWVGVIELLCESLYWWHPVVWWAKREIYEAQEECCDATVVEYVPSKTYAEAIMSTLDFFSGPDPALPPLAHGVSSMPILKKRLTQIMKRSVSANLSWRARAFVVLYCAISLPVHPLLARTVPDHSFVNLDQPVLNDNFLENNAADEEPTRQSNNDVGTMTTQPVELPPAPSGWWNTPPKTIWTRILSHDGTSELAVAVGNRVSLRTPDHPQSVDLSSANITCAAFHPGNQSFVTGAKDGSVRLWSVADAAAVSTLGNHDHPVTSLAMHPSGRYVATGSDDGTVILWDMRSGAIQTTWTGSGAPVSSVRFAADGTRMAIAYSSWTSADESQLVLLEIIDSEFRQANEILLSGTVAAIEFLSPDVLRMADWTGQLRDWFISDEFVANAGTTERGRLHASVFSSDVPF